tara:strand:+ start:377 stop:655 length:279 start_codon:yes stop_codon:yes gene_type:complete
MNKSDLVNTLSTKSGLFSDDDIVRSVQSILDLITESLTRDQRIEIRNFGTFSTRYRKQRLSRNPRTGTTVLVEEKKHPYFRASKNLKQSLNK